MKLGIALGGGGAKGYAHIGILEALGESNIDCQVIAGTSIGALVGAAYAANSITALKERALKFRLAEIPILLSPTWSVSGFFSGKNGLELMTKLINYENIEDLPKIFGAVSVDLVSGSVVTLQKGNLRQAIRSSIAIPGIFTPVIIEDKILVDGGVLNPVPTTLAKELGADFIIAVDLFADRDFGTSTENLMTENSETGKTSLLNSLRSIPEMLAKLAKSTSGKLQKDTPINILGVIENTLAISQQALTERAMSIYPPNLVIQPKVGKIGLLDFHKAEQGIAIGYEAMKARLPSLEKQFR